MLLECPLNTKHLLGTGRDTHRDHLVQLPETLAVFRSEEKSEKNEDMEKENESTQRVGGLDSIL